MLAKQVAGVEVAFAPRFICALGELPVTEAGTEAACDGLRFVSALIVAEAVVGEAERLREHPAFTVVLGEKGFDAFFTVTVGSGDCSLFSLYPAPALTIAVGLALLESEIGEVSAEVDS